MAGVYVFDYNDVDLDTTGLVGDLQPIECTFHEEKNGESSLTMTLCYDELHKWAAVKVGSYIKAQVPVRIPPKIINNKYAEEVMTYRVKNSVDAYAYIWQSSGIVERPQGNPMIYPMFMYRSANEKKQVKVKRRIKAGTEVLVLEQHDDGRCKVYLPGVGSGWTVLDNLEQVVSHTIPATFAGVESATTATRLSYQLFQVVTVEQTLDSVTVTARHVFYELATTFTSYKSTWPVEAHKAIEGIFDGLVTPEDRFTCLTDASHKAGALDYERVNMVQALLDPEHGICAQYGLSLIRDNYDLYALKNVGSDRGFVVEYGKNMLSVERIEDISNVVTRIIPFGKDAKGNLVFMDGSIYADSAHVEEYAMPRTMYLDCSDTATESDTMTLAQVKAELKARAEAEFAAGCDLPELTMTVDFISLGDTEEYKQYRNLDKVYLFDRITVKDKVRGYNYNAEVVAVTHNVLTGQLESVTLGSIQKGTGIRKIATWQVPEVDGANIRLQSIAAGTLAGGAVSESNLQTGAVSTRAIDAYAITTEKLAAGAITADKIGAGEITTDKLAAKSVTADKLDAEFVISDFIEAGSITTDMLAAGAVTADKLDANAISADFIASGSITADKLAAGVLSADLIGAHSITADKIATGTITAESGIIANGAIGTTQIADGSITSAKIVNLSADVITSGTLSTERLLIKGTDGVIYEINAQSSGLTAAELSKEQYKNQINGTVIVAESITAAQLAAEAVTANKILAGAVTAEKIAADAVTADKIKAGAITTAKVSSDFGQSLDLSSNRSINAIVTGLTKTYVQYDQPSGTFNVGDVWVKAQAPLAWSTMLSRTWEAAKADEWGGWAYTEQPATYAWNGEKWVLTVDYNVVEDNSTSIRQTKDAITLKADQTTVDALSGRVTQNSTEIRQTAEAITLKAEKSELDALTGVVNKHGTEIEQTAEAIKLKADKTELDALSGTVSKHGTSIEQNAKNIALKANQTTVDALGNTVASHGTAIQQNASDIALKASQSAVDGLTGRVSASETAIQQNASQIALKANKTDPAGSVSTSTVTVDANGVNIKTGGTFTVDSGNFDVDASGTLKAYGATLENANVFGTILSGGSPVLTSNDIHIGTDAPGNPHVGMAWIKPDTSTSAQTSFSAPVPWRLHENMASSQNNYRTGVLSGTAVASVGTTYTYKAQVPVYIGSYSAQPTGAYVHFEILSGANGSVLLHAEKEVTITEYGSGDKIIEFNFPGDSWVGNNANLHFRIYTTPLANHREYNVMTSSNSSLNISLVCISSSSAGAQGWRQCEVYYYA